MAEQTTEPTPTTETTTKSAQAATGETADTVVSPEPQQTTKPQSATDQESTEPTKVEPGPEGRVVPKPSEYELPEGMPDDVRAFAHEHGFSQDQLNATINQFGGYLNGMKQAEQQTLRKLGEGHLKTWGNDAKHKLSLAKQALHQNDPEGKLLTALNQSGWGNHPDVLDFLYNIGKSMQEGGFLKSSVTRKPGEQTAARALFGKNHPSKGE